MKKYLPLLLFVFVLSSCIKDELMNAECDILNAWVEGDQYKENFYEASQMRMENISSAEKEIIFTVRSLISLPKEMPVFFDVTPGATIEPASGTVQDFTKGPVVYTVTSQDGAWKRQYTVSFREASLPTFVYSFENFNTVKSETNYYHEFYEIDHDGTPIYLWATGNSGAVLIKKDSQPEDQPTYSMVNGYKGRGVCLNTQGTGQLGEYMKKPIAAGNLFMGKFIFDNLLFNPLQTTQFGYVIDREPVRITGYYKYHPGPVFTDKDKKEVPGRVDEPSIYAVFYRNKDEQGNKVFLYGDDVLTSPYIVSKAQVESLPPTDEWTRFEMFFEGEDADNAMVAEKAYNLTIVFSSSKDGAAFEGAIGSELCIDEVEISFEKPDNE